MRAPRLIALALLATACGAPDGPIGSLPRDLSVAEGRLVAADNRFAFGILKAVARQPEGRDNLFISPLSISMALGMTLNGAAGATADSMRRALELSELTIDDANAAYRSVIDLLRDLDANVQFRIANSIWYRQGFEVEPAFLDVNRRFFDARVEALDFASPTAPATINQWVSAGTEGKIPRIVSQIPADMVMYLVNAIYFKGAWTYRFDPQDTQDRPFRLASGTTKPVPTMTRDGTFYYHRDSAVEVVDLPYGRGAYRMTVLMPVTGGDLGRLIDALDQTAWDRAVAGLDSVSNALFLPRFTLQFGAGLVPTLRGMGMGIAFGDQANFTGIRRSGGLQISEVKHKSFVDVNEEGTEAAAATSVGVRVTSVAPEVRVDRPFVFAIRERFSGTILFIGKITDPTVANAGTVD